MNVPTNGRQVLYYPQADSPTDRIFKQFDGPLQGKAATICHVHGPECVNLAVLDQNGNLHSRSSVKLYPDGSFVKQEERDRGGFAMWPERIHPTVLPPGTLRSDAFVHPPAHEQPEPGNADDGTPPDQR